MNNHFLSQSLSLTLLLSLFLSLSLNVEPPWEGGGVILGTTPHPAMILDAHKHLLDLSHHHVVHYLHYYTISIFIINHHHNNILTVTLKQSTLFWHALRPTTLGEEVKERCMTTT